MVDCKGMILIGLILFIIILIIAILSFKKYKMTHLEDYSIVNNPITVNHINPIDF